MLRLLGLGPIFAVLMCGLLAVPTVATAQQPKKKEKKPGVLHVYDAGTLFTEGGIDRAKVAMGKAYYEQETTLTIDTFAGIPKDKTPPAKGEEAKFFEQWAKSVATGDRAKGIYVLVCRSPGYVQVLADKASRDRGFAAEHEQRLREMLLGSFKEAAQAKKDGKSDEEQAKIRDKALSSSVDYVSSILKGTVK